MKFLVLLIVSLVGLPKNNLINRLDLWFLSWQALLTRVFAKLRFFLVFLLSVSLPLIFIGLILYFLRGYFFNIPLFFATLIFLYYALDNRKELIWLAKYTNAYNKNDTEKLHLYAYKLLEFNNFNTKPVDAQISIPPNYFADKQMQQNLLLKKIIWITFESFFLPLFWYLVLNPLVPVFVKLLEKTIETKLQNNQEVDATLLKIQKIMHWIPARFFGLSMTIVAFSKDEFKKWWQDKFNFSISTQDYLFNQLKAYLSLDYNREDASIFSDNAQKDLLGLKDLVWRTLAFWLGISATLVILF